MAIRYLMALEAESSDRLGTAADQNEYAFVVLFYSHLKYMPVLLRKKIIKYFWGSVFFF